MDRNLLPMHVSASSGGLIDSSSVGLSFASSSSAGSRSRSSTNTTSNSGSAATTTATSTVLLDTPPTDEITHQHSAPAVETPSYLGNISGGGGAVLGSPNLFPIPMIRSQSNCSNHNGQASPSAASVLDLNDLEKVLKERGLISELRSTLNMIAIPLLTLAAVAIGFILKWAEDILVPFVIAVFITYLLRPSVNFLSRPLGECGRRPSCGSHRYTALPTGDIEMASNEAALGASVANGDNNTSNNTGMSSNNMRATPRRQADQGGIEPDFLSGDADDDFNNGKVKQNDAGIIMSSVGVGTGGSGLDGSTNGNNNSNTRHRHYPSQAQTLRARILVLRCPRWLAVALSLMWVGAVCAGLIILVVDAVQSFEHQNLAQYETRLRELLTAMLLWLKHNFNVDGSYLTDQLTEEFDFVNLTKNLILATMDGVAYVFVTFLFVLYMLFEESNKDNPNNVSRSHSRASHMRMQIDAQIQQYLVVKTVISAIVGFFVYILLGPILQIKMAHLFGVVTFLANFVPYVGAIIATLLPLPVVLLDPAQSGLNVLLAVALPVAMHTIVGNVIEPKVFGVQMELHPVVIMLSLSFWYAVWGVPGAILSVPITAVLRIILSNVKHPYAIVALRLLEGKLPGSTAFHS